MSRPFPNRIPSRCPHENKLTEKPWPRCDCSWELCPDCGAVFAAHWVRPDHERLHSNIDRVWEDAND